VMWGFPVMLGIAAAIPLVPLPSAAMRDIFLICGVASSLLYVAMNIIVPAQSPGYSAASQVVSELSAVGAPARPLWVVLGLFYTVLVTAFGWGVRIAAGDDRRLRIAGVLIAIYGALGIVWVFAPMHQREVLAAGGGGVTEVIYLAALALAASALGTAFRLYSITTFVILLSFGVQMVREAPRVGTGGPTPLIGVWQRINIGVFVLWVIVLAIVLLVRGHEKDRRAPLHALAQPA